MRTPHEVIATLGDAAPVSLVATASPTGGRLVLLREIEARSMVVEIRVAHPVSIEVSSLGTRRPAHAWAMARGLSLRHVDDVLCRAIQWAHDGMFPARDGRRTLREREGAREAMRRLYG